MSLQAEIEKILGDAKSLPKWVHDAYSQELWTPENGIAWCKKLTQAYRVIIDAE